MNKDGGCVIRPPSVQSLSQNIRDLRYIRISWCHGDGVGQIYRSCLSVCVYSLRAALHDIIIFDETHKST